jgi:hypothetical protein
MSESSKEIKLTYARSGEIYPDPLSLDVMLRDIHHFPNSEKQIFSKTYSWKTCLVSVPVWSE